MSDLNKKIQFRHFRFEMFGIPVNTVDSQGGYTLAYVELDDNVAISIARCSDTDNFSKKLGRELSAEKLIKAPVEISLERLSEILRMDAYDLRWIEQDVDIQEAIYGKDRFKTKK